MRNFYYQLLIGALLIGLPILVSGQSTHSKVTAIIALDEATVPQEYYDPSFPHKANSSDDAFALAEYNRNLEAYAKSHPAFPVLAVSNPSDEQKDQYNIMVENWISSYGTYFPTFIQYSRFNKKLSSSDDYLIYESARNEWLKRNPEKAMVIEEIKGLMMNLQPEKYNSLINNQIIN